MEEEEKKVIAVNDSKENVWTQFNDILEEASSFFMLACLPSPVY